MRVIDLELRVKKQPDKGSSSKFNIKTQILNSMNLKVMFSCFYYSNLISFANCNEKEYRLVELFIMFLRCGIKKKKKKLSR